MKLSKIIRKIFQVVLIMLLITKTYGQTVFSDPVLINSQICPTSVYACDFDNDADNDVISTSYWDGIIYWHENLDGSGNFGTAQLITNIAEGANSVYACDIDGDGDNDVISASWLDNKIAWYENIDGAGSFGPQQIITTSAIEAHTVYACDIDGDGDNDVLSASYGDNKIAWYKNLDGNGNFSDQIIITNSAINALSVYACDIDGDGDNDVLSASGEDNKIALYINTDGIGNFADQYVISTSVDRPFCVYACDIDGDGDNDVLSASENDDKIAWYENIDGRGHFGPQQIISVEADGAEVVYACDIDNDGDNDVLSACYWGNKIALYENIDGKGNFSEEIVISNTAYGIFSVYAADLNGDEKIDVLSASAVGDKIEWQSNLSLSSQLEIFNDENLIYPNPTDGIINLELQDYQQIKKIEIADINGRIIHEKSELQLKNSIDLSKNKNGIYIIKIYSDKNEFSHKILKIN
ncbi:T9SS type A sorting domain-containing protein, partial [Bacteroidota bacterium]